MTACCTSTSYEICRSVCVPALFPSAPPSGPLRRIRLRRKTEVICETGAGAFFWKRPLLLLSPALGSVASATVPSRLLPVAAALELTISNEARCNHGRFARQSACVIPATHLTQERIVQSIVAEAGWSPLNSGKARNALQGIACAVS